MIDRFCIFVVFRIATMEKLSGLENLKTLSANGNPIEALPMYRVFIVGCIPKLKNLVIIVCTSLLSAT
jgi:hypothetical protein